MNRIIITIILLIIFSIGLKAIDFTKFDDSYIVSIKFNKCLKVKDYPEKNVKPSYLIKKGCNVQHFDDDHGALKIRCDNENIDYFFLIEYNSCMEVLERLQEIYQ